VEAASARHRPPPTGQPLKILIAEDNPINQRLLMMLLRRYGHDVIAVDNGREAVQAVQDDSFDIVLMDSSMPVMDGIEATRRIRSLSDARLAATPIVAVTALALQGERERHLAAGMNDYVTKPIKPGPLLDAIYKAVPA
jgi:CheY-like chemotaxis protein